MNKVKILHIIDDKKFIEMCQDTFDLNFILNVYSNSKEFRRKLQNQEYHLVVIHYMRPESVEVLLSEHIKIPIVWFFWGADGFSLGKFHNKFLLRKTKNLQLLLSFHQSILLGINGLIKFIRPNLIDKTYSYKNLIKAINKVDIIVPIVPEDFYLLKDHYNFKAKLFHLNYINPVIDKPVNETIGRNILLGNSASYPNNHIEIIDDLCKVNNFRKDSKIIIPLNYGNNGYAKYIKKYAERKLDGKVNCLMEFLPFEEYEMVLNSCDIMIMNHLRQQGLGNIIQGLFKGIHVYLQEKSTLYTFLKTEGFIIGEISEIHNLRALTFEEKEKNRERCKSVFGKKTQHQKVRHLMELIVGKKLNES